MYECVASMDEADERHCSELIGVSPWFCDAGEVSPCSRPRYYWLRNITVAEMTDVYFQGGGVHFSLGPQEVPELTAFLEPGVVKAVEDGGNFFCFLRPQARGIRLVLENSKRLKFYRTNPTDLLLFATALIPTG
jgi:hypothetical protein